jgi:hypothetical protein
MRRREFTRAVKAEIVLRATNAQGVVCCEGCGLVLGKRKFEIDHILAEQLIVDKSRKLTAADGQLLGMECCHRGEDGKTNKDVAAIARAKRRQENDLGFATKKQPMRSRGFPQSAKRQHVVTKPPVPRARSLYATEGE